MESELTLSRGGFPPLSARGCVQQLMPIEAGSLRRTINGKLIYTGQMGGRKYRSLIVCEDKASLAFEGLWRGEEVRVGCVHRLWQKVVGGEATLERDPVGGSVFGLAADQEEINIQEVRGRKVILASEIKDDAFISYRPWLDMRVVDFSFSTNEWGLKAGWRLVLEEI